MIHPVSTFSRAHKGRFTGRFTEQRGDLEKALRSFNLTS